MRVSNLCSGMHNGRGVNVHVTDDGGAGRGSTRSSRRVFGELLRCVRAQLSQHYLIQYCHVAVDEGEIFGINKKIKTLGAFVQIYFICSRVNCASCARVHIHGLI